MPGIVSKPGSTHFYVRNVHSKNLGKNISEVKKVVGDCSVTGSDRLSKKKSKVKICHNLKSISETNTDFRFQWIFINQLETFYHF